MAVGRPNTGALFGNGATRGALHRALVVHYHPIAARFRGSQNYLSCSGTKFSKNSSLTMTLVLAMAPPAFYPALVDPRHSPPVSRVFSFRRLSRLGSCSASGPRNSTQLSALPRHITATACRCLVRLNQSNRRPGHALYRTLAFGRAGYWNRRFKSLRPYLKPEASPTPPSVTQ